jgi:hypothetical protein
MLLNSGGGVDVDKNNKYINSYFDLHILIFVKSVVFSQKLHFGFPSQKEN